MNDKVYAIENPEDGSTELLTSYDEAQALAAMYGVARITTRDVSSLSEEELEDVVAPFTEADE